MNTRESTLFNNPLYADYIFEDGAGDKLYSHKIVLMIKSSYYYEKFKDETETTIEKVEYFKPYFILIKYLYTNIITFDHMNLHMAEYYLLVQLVKHHELETLVAKIYADIVNNFERLITNEPENVISVIFHLSPNGSLKSLTLDFLKKNPQYLTPEILSHLKPDDISANIFIPQIVQTKNWHLLNSVTPQHIYNFCIDGNFSNDLHIKLLLEIYSHEQLSYILRAGNLQDEAEYAKMKKRNLKTPMGVLIKNMYPLKIWLLELVGIVRGRDNKSLVVELYENIKTSDLIIIDNNAHTISALSCYNSSCSEGFKGLKYSMEIVPPPTSFSEYTYVYKCTVKDFPTGHLNPQGALLSPATPPPRS